MHQLKIQFLIFSILLFGLVIPAFPQKNLSNINQALRYSRYARVSLKIIPIKVSPTRFKVQFIAEKIEDQPVFSSYNFSYSILKSYEEPITSEKIVFLNRENLKYDTDRHWVFEIPIDVPEDVSTSIALFTAFDTRQEDEYTYTIDLKSSYVSDHPDFGAYFANDVPFDQNFLNVGEYLLFKSESGPNMHLYYYPIDFDVPFPPMEIKSPSVPKQLEIIDEGDFFANTPKNFDKAGYYFIQSDTLKNVGLIVKTAHQAFPKVQDWDEMVEIVTYISTRKEHETLLLAQDKKRALDEYWFGLTKNPSLSKDLIREYFRQVEFANILFSDFKEGWKTDKGMVFIVMGSPQSVNFYLDREVWTYGGMDESSKIRFTFARVKNILTPHYYVLNRSKAYQPVWFKNISIWRSGKMAF
jgi:GWxTD domain-containing protein